jgi:hypothetical protein
MFWPLPMAHLTSSQRLSSANALGAIENENESNGLCARRAQESHSIEGTKELERRTDPNRAPDETRSISLNWDVLGRRWKSAPFPDFLGK